MVRALLGMVILAALSFPTALQADQADRDKARALFKAGKEAYAAGRYERAARLFSEGYQLDPQPAFLLNIAQSHRSAGQPSLALEHYRKFLEVAPQSPLRAQVEDLIRELSAQARPQTAPPPAASAPAAAVSPEPAREPPPPPPPAPFYRRWWFWTAVGALVVGTGIGVGAYYGSREPSYVKEGSLGSVRW